MKKHKSLTNIGMLIILLMIAVLFMVLYMTLNVNFSKPKFWQYSFKIRTPRLIAMCLAAFAIGAATLVFQSIINNRIVTPCLLGMNALYTLLHVLIAAFFGTASVLLTNRRLNFGIDLITMAVVALLIYGFLFKIAKYNVLYILLIGTVLTSFFGSMQETIIRGMDPSEYDSVLNQLVASFTRVNSEIISYAIIALIVVAIVLWRDIKLLNVITLGREQAINLGVDYNKVIRRLLVGVVLYIAIATALVGPISFLGLIIANLARALFKTYKHQILICATILFGLVVLVCGEVLVEHVFDYNIPVSVFVTIFGGGYFLYLLIFKRRSI